MYRGISPMRPAAWSIDTHNSALRWNKALRDNAGSPSGTITTGMGPDGTPTVLSDDQFQRLKTLIDAIHRQAERRTAPDPRGRPRLEGHGLSPKEMDFGNGVWAAAMHICAAYGVPPQMLGIPGSQTHANYEQANLSFWQQTILRNRPVITALLYRGRVATVSTLKSTLRSSLKSCRIARSRSLAGGKVAGAGA
jgi:phage portal protein BeeE